MTKRKLYKIKTRFLRCFYKDIDDYFSRDYYIPNSEGLSDKGYRLLAEKKINNDKDIIAYTIIEKSYYI